MAEENPVVILPRGVDAEFILETGTAAAIHRNTEKTAIRFAGQHGPDPFRGGLA